MKERYKWLISFSINIALLLFAVFFVGINYESSDDYVISERIVADYAFVGYVNYYLCQGMIFLQNIFRDINIYIVSQLIVCCAALSIITKMFMDRVTDKIMYVILAAALVFYTADLYSLVQFTKTAGLLSAAGLLLLTDSVIFRRGIGYYITGIVLFALAVAYRFEMIVFAVGYAGLFVLFWLFENRKELVPGGYLQAKRIAGYVLVAVLLAGSCGIYSLSEMKNYSTDELKDYHEYNHYRYSYVDYAIYNDYKDNPESYKETGLTSDDFFLIRKWYFDYDGAASLENLKKIKSIYDGRSASESRPPLRILRKTLGMVWRHARKRSVLGCHLLLLIALAIYAFIKCRKKTWLYILALGAATFVLYFMLNHMGRAIYRVLFIIDFCATLWLLYCVAEKNAPHEDFSEEPVPGKAYERFAMAASVLICVVVLAVSFFGVRSACNKSLAKHNSIKVMTTDIEELIKQDKEHAYVFSTLDKRYDKDYLNPLKAPELHENVFTFGSWGTKSPYLNDRMKAYGLDNVFSDIIDNEKVYVIDNHNSEKMEKYLNRWYGKDLKGKKIRYEKEGDIGGSKFWRVVTE